MTYVNDKYRNNPTVADRYYSETWKVRESHKPTVGESLKTYSSRLGRIIRTAEEDSIVHVKWHTHQSAGECWICVQNQVLNSIYAILSDQLLLKNYGKFVFDDKLNLKLPGK